MATTGGIGDAPDLGSSESAPVADQIDTTQPQSVTVPDASLLFRGAFSRVGSADLKIVDDTGASFFIKNYFGLEKRADLVSPDGAMLSADLVAALAGPLAPGQMAQSGAQQSGSPAIGRVQAVSGDAIVIRNGVTVTLHVGDAIRKGDVVQTAAGASLGLVFADGTAFHLAGDARIVLSEFAYGAGADNAALISLVEGSIAFVAGQMAKTGDLKIKTPVATLDVNSAAALVEIDANNGQTKFSVMVEPSGNVGRYDLYDNSGALLASANNSSFGWLVTPNGVQQATATSFGKTSADLAREAVIVQQLFQVFTAGQTNPVNVSALHNQTDDNITTGAIGGGGGALSTPSDSGAPKVTPIQNGPGTGVQSLPPSIGGTSGGPTSTGTNGSGGAGGAGGGGDRPALPNVLRGTIANETFGPNEAAGYKTTDGVDWVYAGAGNDIIIAGHGGGNDIYDGGPGSDEIRYLSTSNPVTFDLHAFTAESTSDNVDTGRDVITNIETIVTGAGNDVFKLHADAGAWMLDAGAGIDTLTLAGSRYFGASTPSPGLAHFEIIDLNTTNANTLDLNGAVAKAAIDGNDTGYLQIKGNGQDSVILTADAADPAARWHIETSSAHPAIAGYTLYVYDDANGQALVYVQNGVTVGVQPQIAIDAAPVGLEDNSILVSFNVVIPDATNPFVLETVIITGVPAQVSLDAGIRLANGDWLIDRGQGATSAQYLDGLTNNAAAKITLRPDLDFNGSLALSFVATIRDTVTGADIVSHAAVSAPQFQPVNDAPVIDLNGPAAGQNLAATFTEGAANLSVAADVLISDIDSANIATATVTLANPLDGALESLTLTGTLPSGITAVFNTQNTRIEFTGAASAADYAAVLAMVQYSNTSQNPDATPRIITFNVSDGAASSTATTTVTVVPVNDAPGGADQTFTIFEDGNHVFTSDDFGYSDIENDVFQSLKIGSLPAAGTLIFQGAAVTPADIDAGFEITKTDLDSGLLRFEPAANGAGNGYASFTFQVRDAGNALDATPNAITFNVTPVNDLPVTNAAFGAGAEDTTIAIVLSGSDVEGVVSGFRITTLPTNGSLFYDAAGAQLVATSGGIANLSSSGANTLTIYFKPDANWNGSTSLSYVAVDSEAALGQIVNVPITVAPVNDAPNGADNIITILEDNGRALSASDFGYADIENDGFQALKIASLSGNGTLSFRGVAITQADIDAGFEITKADIDSNLLRFAPAANDAGNGYASFTFQVRDTGLALDPTSNRITFNVTPVNDLPVTNAGSGTGLEDAAIAIVLSGTDVEGLLTGFRITTLPTNGSLFYDAAGAQPVTASAGIATLSLGGANSLTLYFKPNPDWNGSTSLSYAAIDSENALGQTVVVPITVTAVNDAPTIAGDLSGSVLLAETYILTTADLGFTDVDDNAIGINYAVSNQVNGIVKLSNVAATSFTAADVAAGRVTFTQNGTDSTAASFSVTVDDGNEDQSQPATHTFNIAVTLAVRPETIAPSTVTGVEDQSGPIAIVLSGSDADGTVASYNITAPLNGTLYRDAAMTQLITNSVTATGNAADNFATTVYFRPNANFDGAIGLQFSAVDNLGFADLTSATVKIDVTPAVDDATFSFGRGSVSLIVNGGFSSGLSGWSSHFDNSAFFTTTAYQVFDNAGALFVYNLPGPLSGAYALAAPPLLARNTFDGASTLQQSFEVPYALEDLKISYDFFVAGRFSQPQDGTSLTSLVYGTTQFARIDVLKSGSAPYDTSPTAVVDNLFIGRTMASDSFSSGARQEWASPSWLHNAFTAGTEDLASLTSDQVYILRFANLTTFFAPQHMGIDNVSVVAQIGSLGYQNGGDIVIGKIALGDTDGSEKITELVLSGFAAGVIFKIDGVQAGALQGNGTWVISDRGQLDALATTNLTATMPANYTGAFTMTSVATVTDSVVLSNGTTQTATRQFNDTLKVEILVPNDAPTSADKLITINEDTARILSAADFPFSDSNGDTFLGVKIVSLPADGAGTLKLNGVAVTAGQVISATDIAANGLVFTPGTNLSGTGAASFTFQVQDNGGSGGYDQDSVGTDLSSVQTMSFNVTPVADAANFPAPAAGAIAGNEDTTITLRTLDVSLADPSETLKLVLSGFPAGSIFKIDGVQIGALDTTPGSATLGKWVITDAGEIAALHDHALQVTPPANNNGQFFLNIAAITTDATFQNTVTRTLNITINSINDLPIANGDSLSTNEDTALINLAATLRGNDSDIETLTANLVVSAVSNATGGTINLNNGNPIFTPTANFSGIAGFDYTIRDADGGTATAHVSIDVAPRADQPIFSLGGTGNEDTDIVIGRVGRTDTDGSEQITKLVLSGFLAGAVFKVNGVQVGALGVGAPDDGKWVITDAAQIASLATSDLVMTPRANDFGALTLTTVASVSDSAVLSTGATSVSANFTNSATVNVVGVNDVPILVQPLADQTAVQHAAFSYQFASTAFSDIEQPNLTLTATLQSGAALPSWLTFDPATRTFSGALADAGTLHIKVTASDGAASVSDVFDIVVAANHIPLAAAVTYPYFAGEDSILTLSASDADVAAGDTLRYKFTVIPNDVAVYLDAAHTIAVAVNELFTTDTVYVVSSVSGLPANLTYVAVDSYLVESTPVNATAVIPVPGMFVGTAGNDVANSTAGVLTGFTGGTIALLTDTAGDTFRPGGGTDTIIASRGKDTIQILAATDISAGDVFNGGSGANVLDIGTVASIDLRPASLTNLQTLRGGNAGNVVVMSIAQFLQFSAIDLGGGTNRIDVYLSLQNDVSGQPYDLSGFALPTLANVQTVNLISADAGSQFIQMSAAQASAFAQIDLRDGTDALTIKVAGDFTLAENKVVNVERITIDGDDLANILVGSSGDEIINGNGGNDTLIGGRGINTLYGGAGDDLYKFDAAGGSNTVSDLVGTDTLSFRDGSGSALQTAFDVSRGAGAVNVSFGLTSVAATLGTGLIAFETPIYGASFGTLKIASGLEGDALGGSLIAGTGGADTITAYGSSNLLAGGAGNDTLTGEGNGDLYVGGTGDDTLINTGSGLNRYVFKPGDGNDTINDAGGFQRFPSSGDVITIDMQGGTFSTLSFHDDNVATGAGNLVIKYGNGDSITAERQFAGEGQGVEFINFNGGSFAGYSFGNANYALTYLDSGSYRGIYTGSRDIIVGAKDAANELLGVYFGGGFFGNNMLLFGGDKSDQIHAGDGQYLLVGGAGSDNFFFKFAEPGVPDDIIADFQDGIDTIDLSVLAGSSPNTYFQNLSFSYDQTFTAVTDSASGLTFKLFGQHTLTANDFIFSSYITTFTGTSGNDRIDALTGEIVGFTGGRSAHLFDAFTDIFTPGGGDDTIILGPKGGQINLYAATDISAGDVFAGGNTNNDTISVNETPFIDLRGASITGFEYLLGGTAPNWVTMSIEQYSQFSAISLNGAGYNQISVDVGGKTTPQTFVLPPLYDSSFKLDALHIIASGTGNEQVTLTDALFSSSSLGIPLFLDVDLGAGNADEVRIEVLSSSFNAAQYENRFSNVEILTISGSGSLFGTSRADTLITSGNYVQLYGGGGADTLIANGNYGSFFGGDGNDTLRANGLSNALFGEGGDDTLYGNGSTYFGTDRDDGHDTVIGSGSGTDKLGFTDYGATPGSVITAIDVARNGNGYHVSYGNSSVDYVDGGGTLVLEIGWAFNNNLFRLDIRADIANGQFVPTWTFDTDLTGTVSKSVIVGTGGSDVITSVGNTNMMFGGAGNDTLTGGSNFATDATAGRNDIYVGGKGSDTLIDLGRGANAFVFAIGDGADTIDDRGSTAFDGYSYGDRIVIGAPGTILQTFGATHDNAGANPLDLTIQYSADDKVTIIDQYAGTGHNIEYINFNGSSYRGYDFGVRDYLINAQATGPDSLKINGPQSFSVGNAGVSNILGSSMYDADNDPQTAPVPIAGGAGGILIGAEQDDVLYAGYASDLLIGGAGADSFKFTTRGFSNRGEIDLIADFQDGIDKFDLRGINIGWAPADHVTFASLAATYDEASNVTTLTHAGANSNISGFDFSVRLYGDHRLLHENDFIFV